jgi:hypothetical protein
MSLRDKAYTGQEVIREGMKYRATALEDAITLIEAHYARVGFLRLEGVKRVLRREIRKTKEQTP